MLKNRISQLRKARGLTQQALAKLAGTSQQQVQRIEAGVQGARLELAIKISAVLGAELPDVFPALAPKQKRTLRDSRYVIDDKKLQEVGIDPDPKIWTAKFFAHDGRIFQFSIPSDEKSRLERLFGVGGTTFLVFGTDTHQVAINHSKIAALQFLFDLGVVSEEEEEKHELKLHLIAARDAICFDIEPDQETLDEEGDDSGISQFQSLFFFLELGVDDEVLHFDDVDGERVYLRPTELLAVEVPLVCCDPALWNAHREGYEENEESRMTEPQSAEVVK